MPDSQLLGLPPTTYNDRLIYKAIYELDKPIFSIAPAKHGAPHDSRSASMIIGSAFAIFLVLLITGTRLWVRRYRSRALGADDVVIIPAALGCVAYLSLDIAQESVGCLGKHVYDCTYQEFRWFYELAHTCFPIFYFTVFCVKISITLANRRITGMTSKKWQIAHWTYLALLITIMPICVFLNIFPCSPIATYFTLQSIAAVPDPRTIKCLDQNAISLATRVLHIVTDWLLLPVPIIVIWRLQMPLSRKIRLMMVFAVGVVSSVASIIRNVLTERATLDLTYDYYTVYAWDVVDIFFATVVASLPALNGIFDQGIKRMMTWNFSSAGSLFSKLRSSKSNSQNSGDYDVKALDGNPGHAYNNGLVVENSLKSTDHDGNDVSILSNAAEIELQSPLGKV